jgi:hypothetical protein
MANENDVAQYNAQLAENKVSSDPFMRNLVAWDLSFNGKTGDDWGSQLRKMASGVNPLAWGASFVHNMDYINQRDGQAANWWNNSWEAAGKTIGGAFETINNNRPITNALTSSLLTLGNVTGAINDASAEGFSLDSLSKSWGETKWADAWDLKKSDKIGSGEAFAYAMGQGVTAAANIVMTPMEALTGDKQHTLHKAYNQAAKDWGFDYNSSSFDIYDDAQLKAVRNKPIGFAVGATGFMLDAATDIYNYIGMGGGTAARSLVQGGLQGAKMTAKRVAAEGVRWDAVAKVGAAANNRNAAEAAWFATNHNIADISRHTMIASIKNDTKRSAVAQMLADVNTVEDVAKVFLAVDHGSTRAAQELANKFARTGYVLDQLDNGGYLARRLLNNDIPEMIVDAETKFYKDMARHVKNPEVTQWRNNLEKALYNVTDNGALVSRQVGPLTETGAALSFIGRIMDHAGARIGAWLAHDEGATVTVAEAANGLAPKIVHLIHNVAGKASWITSNGSIDTTNEAMGGLDKFISWVNMLNVKVDGSLDADGLRQQLINQYRNAANESERLSLINQAREVGYQRMAGKHLGSMQPEYVDKVKSMMSKIAAAEFNHMKQLADNGYAVDPASGIVISAPTLASQLANKIPLTDWNRVNYTMAEHSSDIKRFIGQTGRGALKAGWFMNQLFSTLVLGRLARIGRDFIANAVGIVGSPHFAHYVGNVALNAPKAFKNTVINAFDASRRGIDNIMNIQRATPQQLEEIASNYIKASDEAHGEVLSAVNDLLNHANKIGYDKLTEEELAALNNLASIHEAEVLYHGSVTGLPENLDNNRVIALTNSRDEAQLFADAGGRHHIAKDDIKNEGTGDFATGWHSTILDGIAKNDEIIRAKTEQLTRLQSSLDELNAAAGADLAKRARAAKAKLTRAQKTYEAHLASVELENASRKIAYAKQIRDYRQAQKNAAKNQYEIADAQKAWDDAQAELTAAEAEYNLAEANIRDINGEHQYGSNYDVAADKGNNPFAAMAQRNLSSPVQSSVHTIFDLGGGRLAITDRFSIMILPKEIAANVRAGEILFPVRGKTSVTAFGKRIEKAKESATTVMVDYGKGGYFFSINEAEAIYKKELEALTSKRTYFSSPVSGLGEQPNLAKLIDHKPTDLSHSFNLSIAGEGSRIVDDKTTDFVFQNGIVISKSQINDFPKGTIFKYGVSSSENKMPTVYAINGNGQIIGLIQPRILKPSELDISINEYTPKAAVTSKEISDNVAATLAKAIDNPKFSENGETPFSDVLPAVLKDVAITSDQLDGIWKFLLQEANGPKQETYNLLKFSELIAEHPNTSPELLSTIVNDKFFQGDLVGRDAAFTILRVAGNPNTPASALLKISKSKLYQTQIFVAINPNSTDKVLASAYKNMSNNSAEYAVPLALIAANPNTPAKIINELTKLNVPEINYALRKNELVSEEQRVMLGLSEMPSKDNVQDIDEALAYYDNYADNVDNNSAGGFFTVLNDENPAKKLLEDAAAFRFDKPDFEARRTELGKRPADYVAPVQPEKTTKVTPWLTSPSVEIPTEIASHLEAKAAKIQAQIDEAQAARAAALNGRTSTLNDVNSTFNGRATNFAEASKLIKNSLPKQKANKAKVLSLFTNESTVQQRVAGKWRTVSRSTVEKASAETIAKRHYRVIPASSKSGTERFFVFGNKVDWTDPRNVPADLISALGFTKPIADFKKFVASGEWRTNEVFVKWMQDNNVGKIIVADKKVPSGITILALPSKIERGANRPATQQAFGGIEDALLTPGENAVPHIVTKKNLQRTAMGGESTAKNSYTIPGLEEKHPDYTTVEQNIRLALTGIADNRSTATSLLKQAGERRAKINNTAPATKRSVGQEPVRIGGRLAKFQGIDVDGKPFEFDGALADPRTHANISSRDGWDVVSAHIGSVITEKNVAVRTAQVDPGDPNYFPAWEGILNYQWRQQGTKVVDPFIRVLLEKGPDAAAKWLKSDAAGIAYAARIGVGKRFATVKATADNGTLGMLEKDYALMMEEEARKLLPDSTIRDKFLNGQDITVSSLIDNYGGATNHLQTITGRVTEAYKSEMGATAKAVRNMHKIISELPQDALANAPFAQAAYRAGLERGLVLAQAKYGESLPANVLAGIQHEATQSAIKDVKKWLYGAGDHSNLAEAARLLFPFVHAYSFTIRMLRNVMRENPVRAMYLLERGSSAVNGGDMQWVDQNGQPTTFNNADSLVIHLTDAQRGFIGSIPGLEYIKESKSQEFRFSKKSMDVLLGGEILPGAGPLVTIPLSIFAISNPEFWAKANDTSFASGVANYLKSYVLPYGPSTDIPSSIGLPIWMKKTFEVVGYNVSKVTGWNTGAQEIAQNIARMTIEDEQMSKLHNTPRKTPEQIQQQAVNFAIFQAVSNFVNPISTRAKTEFDIMTEKYRSYVDRFGIMGPSYFRQDYPEWESIGASFSQNRYEINPSKTSAESIKKHPEIMDIANNYASESQNIVGWMLNVGGDTTFDDTVYTYLKSASPRPGEPTFVTQMGPSEYQAKAEARSGWAEYNKGLDALNKVALDNGINIEQSPTLMAAKRALVSGIAQKNHAWEVDFNTVGNAKSANGRIHLLLEAIGPNHDSAWYKENKNKPEMQQVSQFLDIWQTAEQTLAQRLGINNSGMLTNPANKDIYNWYYGEVAKLKADSVIFNSWYDKYIGDNGAPNGVGISTEGTN